MGLCQQCLSGGRCKCFGWPKSSDLIAKKVHTGDTWFEELFWQQDEVKPPRPKLRDSFLLKWMPVVAV
eukprot:scaffold6788_cov71-Cyclotella_meneghiniana.AAC.9